MTEHLYFIVSLNDALRFSHGLSQLGITHYHLQPHDKQVAFVFERVSAKRRTILKRFFGADGVSRQN
ncbi:hypothetical protein BRE01_45830 [Brevibacillus reuszeri]|uniref:Uncharacterized protein n=1 Tax=Brevibacillus reuszeri TaxID=54915 RepID=A0A0K9YLB1_9BACL|nr:hypothetical protein [Brevibacillus reuszeri]KNB69447.1 hypothetical protein ADS79_26530 [Brevibacillus reuszeri]MED1861581.1 hypothetical protein [Brevibacillus reuszeri]GED70881.1 hypothetical protein BRE01_45830 [Brevibacillus reuszeri]